MFPGFLLPVFRKERTVSYRLTNWKCKREAHGYVPIVIGMEQRLSLCSFFCPHFGDKNWDMTEMEKGVISGECLVWRRKTHTKGKAIT